MSPKRVARRGRRPRRRPRLLRLWRVVKEEAVKEAVKMVTVTRPKRRGAL
jgi:hypothetical protein